MIGDDYYKYGTTMLIIGLLVLSYLIVKPYLIAIISSMLLTYIFYPIFKLVNEIVKNKNISSIILCILILAIIVLPSLLILNTLIREIPGISSRVVNIVSGSHFKANEYLQTFYEKTGVHLDLSSILQSVFNFLMNSIKNFLAGIPNRLVNIFVVFFLMFFFFRDAPAITEKLFQYFPMHSKHKQIFFRHMENLVQAVVYGHIVTALAQSILAFFGYLIFGVKTPLFFALLTFFLALIPYMGAPFVYAPLSLFMFLNGLSSGDVGQIFRAIGLLLYGVMLVSTIDNFIKPRIIGEKVKIHQGVIFIGILGGLSFFGIIGIVLGPLVLVTVETLFEMYEVKERLRDKIDHTK
ncbi:AI-2E family transporter [Candidatus Woesearchaeota archaeon]|nr:AI-2E family transporter [Candidatus Woesearchaeota archaeon]